MDTPSKKSSATRSVSTQSTAQLAQALALKIHQKYRVALAQNLRPQFIPTLQSKKAALSNLFSDYSTNREYYLMAGCISSPSSDIFAHMDPYQVLTGLLDNPEYMLRYERQLQYGDRCLWSCDMAHERIAACESLLTESILQYRRLACLLEQETLEALEEEQTVMSLLKQGRQDLAKAEDAVENALTEQEELKWSP